MTPEMGGSSEERELLGRVGRDGRDRARPSACSRPRGGVE